MTKTEFFENQVAEYDAWFDRHTDLYRAELDALRRLVPGRGKRVEFGVGSGRFAAPLGIVGGVEPSPGMGALARQRGIAVHEAVAKALPFATGSFAYALMVTVACFLDDVLAAFRDHRVLQKDV